MNISVRIEFENLAQRADVERFVEERLEQLTTADSRITDCHFVFARLHDAQETEGSLCLRLDLTTANGPISVMQQLHERPSHDEVREIAAHVLDTAAQLLRQSTAGDGPHCRPEQDVRTAIDPRYLRAHA